MIKPDWYYCTGHRCTGGLGVCHYGLRTEFCRIRAERGSATTDHYGLRTGYV